MYKKDHTAEWIVIGIFAVIAFIVWIIETGIGSNKYNNGICAQCGGHYIFKETVGHRYFTNYIYICDKCGNLIEVPDYYGE